MQIDSLLQEFECVPLQISSLPQFDQDAIRLFSDESLTEDPYIDFAFLQDITVAQASFRQLKDTGRKESLSAFLLWCAAKSLCEIRQLNWRKIGDNWYEMLNPPFFMPVATGQSSRMASFFLKDIKGSSFESFSQQYRHVVDLAKSGDGPTLGALETFLLAHNLNNLPTLRFTSIKPHRARQKSTHVWWCFGQRYEENARLLVPISIRMHHANGDPVILQQLMAMFDKFTSLAIS